jgi:predicted amidophosphoribosyltransferase
MTSPLVGSGCRYCGGEVPADRVITFCPHCGQNMTVTQCPACSAELEVTWKFCPTCGRRAEDTAENDAAG